MPFAPLFPFAVKNGRFLKNGTFPAKVKNRRKAHYTPVYGVLLFLGYPYTTPPRKIDLRPHRTRQNAILTFEKSANPQTPAKNAPHNPPKTPQTAHPRGRDRGAGVGRGWGDDGATGVGRSRGRGIPHGRERLSREKLQKLQKLRKLRTEKLQKLRERDN